MPRSSKAQGWAKFPSKRSLQTPAPKPGPRKPLPPDVVGVLAGILHDLDCFAGVAQLALLDKACYEVVIPRLYHTVTITSLRGIRLFLDSFVSLLEASSVAEDQDVTNSPSGLSITSPKGRLTYCITSMNHLDINQDSEIRWLREKPPGALQKRIEAWRSSRQHIKLEMMYIEHHNSFLKDSFWLKALFSIFQARHLYWRDYGIPLSAMDPMDPMQMFLVDRENATAQMVIVESIRKWDDDHFTSYDMYRPQPFLPLSKYRYTLCNDHEEWLAEPYWDIKAAVQDWLAEWSEEHKGDAGRKKDVLASENQSQGPAWIFFHPSRRFMEGLRVKRSRADKKEKVLLDHFHCLARGMSHGMDGDEWRAWVTKGVWSG